MSQYHISTEQMSEIENNRLRNKTKGTVAYANV